MIPDVDDLRILRLAAMYEHAFEHFVQDFAAKQVDPVLRAQLETLAPEIDQHEARIEAAIGGILHRLPGDARDAVVRGGLLDVLEVEQAAKDFYVRRLDRLHDPDIVDLFRSLAREEAKHVKIAEDALRHFDSAHRKAALSEESRLFVPNDMPLWEGVSEPKAVIEGGHTFRPWREASVKP
ncbi:MAG: hypothetical protein ACYDDF_14560 [Thermoplasmatota archaeon]